MDWSVVKFWSNKKKVDEMVMSNEQLNSSQGQNKLNEIKENIKKAEVKKNKGRGNINVDYTSSPLSDNPTGEDFFE